MPRQGPKLKRPTGAALARDPATRVLLGWYWGADRLFAAYDASFTCQHVMHEVRITTDRPAVIDGHGGVCTPNLRTNIMDFRGFDSSIISILRGRIPRPIGNLLKILSQAILVGIMLVGRSGV